MVATVLTVYGIETLLKFLITSVFSTWVATVLTVYGIETHVLVDTEYLSCPSAVATVLTVYGIETFNSAEPLNTYPVATVLTVYGIETLHSYPSCRW